MSVVAGTIVDQYRKASPDDRRVVMVELLSEWFRSHPSAKYLIPGLFPSGGDTPPILSPEEEAELALRLQNLDDAISHEEMMKLVFSDTERN